MTLAEAARAELRLPPAALVRLGWAVALVAYCGAAFWLFAHPALLPSDDALFFSRGLTRFSVLDFSPQFPGYPGFIALGRMLLPLFGDPVRALFVLTVAVALALPPAAAAFAWRLGRGPAGALGAFGLSLSCPLLPELALNLLSDGAGILFVVIALAALASAGPAPTRRAAFWAGVALGCAACCRPSDGVLIAGVVIGVAWRTPRLLPMFSAGMAVVALPVLATVLALEGTLYFWAGLQFVSGHTLGWGNTMFSNNEAATGWGGAIAALWGGPVIGLILAGAAFTVLLRASRVPVALLAAAAAFAGHAGWVLLMQNPEHLRHLAPILLLGGLLVAALPAGAAARGVCVMAVLLLNIAMLASTATPAPGAAPPLSRAAAWMAQQPRTGLLAINDGVQLMREDLAGFRVIDMQAPADATLAFAAAGGGYRLSTTPLGSRVLAIFPGRFTGEETQYLYWLAEPDVPTHSK